MAKKTVALEGEVEVSLGDDPQETWEGPPGWTAGPVIYKTYPHLKVKGVPVIYEASCTFNYAGTDSANNGAPVAKGPVTVTVSAGATVLMGSENGVLLDGDSDNNELKVVASGHLKSE